MQTRHFFSDQLRESDYEEIKALLLEGQIVAFPTETVYGLGVDYRNEEAIERLFALKHRPLHNPMILHVSSPTVVERVAMDIPDYFHDLAKEFWPGPLTLVLKKRAEISSKISKDTVAVRMPAVTETCALIEKMGGVLVGTSANLSGQAPFFSASELMKEFSGKIGAVIEGKEAFYKMASCVLSLVENPPRIFRMGPIPIERLEKIIRSQILIG
jgi:L-threonylcarbamoyladenylate synthase